MHETSNYLLEEAVAAASQKNCEPVITSDETFSLLFIHGRTFSFITAFDPVTRTEHSTGRFLGDDIAQFSITACVVGSAVKGGFRILLQAVNHNSAKKTSFIIGDENDTGETVYAWLILGGKEKGPVPLKSFSIVENGPGGRICFLGEHLSLKRRGRLAFMLALVHHFADTALDLQNLIKGGEGND